MVRYADKAWICQHSVQDEEYPESDLVRIDLQSKIIFFKPAPEINGYTVTTDSEFNFGGKCPNTIVISSHAARALADWTEL